MPLFNAIQYLAFVEKKCLLRGQTTKTNSSHLPGSNPILPGVMSAMLQPGHNTNQRRLGKDASNISNNYLT